MNYEVEMKTLVKLLEIPLWFATLYLLGPLVTGFWGSVVVMFVATLTIIWTGDIVINKLERVKK